MDALLISGPPASGKSTLASAVAARLHAALLDQDVLTGALTEVIGDLVGTKTSTTRDSPVSPVPTLRGRVRHRRPQPPRRHARRAGRALHRGAGDPDAWQVVRDRLRAAGGRPALVWLRLPADELVRRLRSRGAGRDPGKLADPAAFAAPPMLRPPVVEHIAVDATARYEQQLEEIFSSLS